jgi:hypothetical protein
LLQYVGLRRRALIRFNAPLEGPAAGYAGDPCIGQSAHRIGIEIDCFSHRESSEQRPGKQRRGNQICKHVRRPALRSGYRRRRSYFRAILNESLREPIQQRRAANARRYRIKDAPEEDEDASAPPKARVREIGALTRRNQRCPRLARNGYAGLGRGTRLGGKQPGEPATPRDENTTCASEMQRPQTPKNVWSKLESIMRNARDLLSS